jgi:Flp pilus assembly protein TadG
MLEMAVVLPTFFLLLFGLIEFGVILFGYCSATFACQTAARYASVHSSTSLAPCSASSVAAITATQIFAPSSYPVVGVHTTWPTGNTVGNPVNVTVTLYYPAGLPVLSTAMVTLSTSSQRIIVR